MRDTKAEILDEESCNSKEASLTLEAWGSIRYSYTYALLVVCYLLCMLILNVIRVSELLP